MKITTFDDCKRAALKIYGFEQFGAAEEIAAEHGIELPLATALKSATTNSERWIVVEQTNALCQYDIRDQALLEIVRNANPGEEDAWNAFKEAGSDSRLADKLLLLMLEKKNDYEELKRIAHAADRYAANMKAKTKALRQLCANV